MIEKWKSERAKLKSQIKRYDRLIKKAEMESDLDKSVDKIPSSEVSGKKKPEK